MLRATGIFFAAVFVAASPSTAQDERPVQINVGGGFTGVYGAASDRVGNGGGFNIGVIYKVTPVVGLQGEYSFNGIKGKDLTLPVFAGPNAGTSVPTAFTARANMQYGTFNVLVSPKINGAKLSPYAITGLGVYYRPVEITTPGVGFVTACDPYWYVCFPEPVAVENVVGKRSSTDFGMNFGGGVNFRITDHTSAYFEIRWHYIWGPTLSNASLPSGALAPTTIKANGSFLPITFGFRF
jgi:opacity protein-like surface antigen